MLLSALSSIPPLILFSPGRVSFHKNSHMHQVACVDYTRNRIVVARDGTNDQDVRVVHVTRRMEILMNIDPGIVSQVLNQVLTAIPYPISKADLIQRARQAGANDQVLGILERLPDKTFNSPQEVQSALQGLGGLGNLGSIV